MDPVYDLYREIYPNVELIIEDPGYDYQAYYIRLNADLMAGKGPDMLLPWFMNSIDAHKLIAAGAFMDLNDLI